MTLSSTQPFLQPLIKRMGAAFVTHGSKCSSRQFSLDSQGESLLDISPHGKQYEISRRISKINLSCS